MTPVALLCRAKKGQLTGEFALDRLLDLCSFQKLFVLFFFSQLPEGYGDLVFFAQRVSEAWGVEGQVAARCAPVRHMYV